ncbi:MAG: HupE/UreJ family protein [Vicinamibacterales bacterium]
MILLVRAPLDAMRDMDVPRRGPGYLDLARVDPVIRDAAVLWIGDFVRLYEGDRQLGRPDVVAARVSLPSDRSFESYDRALAHVTGPGLPHDTDLYWEQGLLDVAFAYPIESDRSEFAISPGLTGLGLRVNVVLRFLLPGGPERAFDLHGDPGIVELDPRWHQAAFRFVEEGFFHILDGIDHLLFLFCLVIPFRRFLSLVAIVTSFTVAHSITLIASAFGLAPDALWFPPLVETLIAASIVYMALENIAAPSLQRRWLITFAFGLVHGFGFSFALRETLQLAGSHVITSLLAFNVGVEIGQVLVLVLLVPALHLLFRFAVAERVGMIILSALLAHTGWHWLVERGGALLQYRFEWPAFDARLLASAMRWLMLLLIVAGALWLIRGLVRRPTEQDAAESETT